jgi:hypothetical protein
MHALTAAKQLGGDINCLVVGSKNCGNVAAQVCAQYLITFFIKDH